MPNTDIFRNDPNARPFSAGEVILTEGDHGDAMFVILDGTVDLTLRGAHLDEVGPGGMIGEMAIVDKGPRSATATAKTDGTIVRVDQKRFLYLVQNTPFFAIEVMRTMAERLRKMDAAP